MDSKGVGRPGSSGVTYARHEPGFTSPQSPDTNTNTHDTTDYVDHNKTVPIGLPSASPCMSIAGVAKPSVSKKASVAVTPPELASKVDQDKITRRICYDALQAAAQQVPNFAGKIDLPELDQFRQRWKDLLRNHARTMQQDVENSQTEALALACNMAQLCQNINSHPPLASITHLFKDAELKDIELQIKKVRARVHNILQEAQHSNCGATHDHACFSFDIKCVPIQLLLYAIEREQEQGLVAYNTAIEKLESAFDEIASIEGDMAKEHRQGTIDLTASAGTPATLDTLKQTFLRLKEHGEAMQKEESPTLPRVPLAR